ncbi:signal peptide peptidase SppA [Gracilibacillus boraciitolerans JCM 21714]|uniref:Signal peptide peptidase SppA n=2 Tax=Gracilibacillus boraciitolerans TaxID=307521 RepID=W4VQX6_9BACI|nr:signal peptide peptidase SppA [Gracilibacillus boraciitolerans JCM 21714]
MNFTKYDELADKIGYSQVNIKSGEHKDMASPLKEVTPEEKEIYQSVVDDSYEKFLEVIVNGRDMDRERVQNLADGRIYSGYEAKELGLIDKLGSLEDATDYIKKSLNQPNLKVVRVTPKNSIMDSFSPNIQSNLIKDIENIIGINNQARLMYIFDQ